MVAAQGGDPRAIDDYSVLPQARSTSDVVAPQDGFVTGIDTEAVGLAAVALGAGRQRVDSRIDPAVGFTLLRKVGEPVKSGEPVVRIHFNDPAPVDEVKAKLQAAYHFGPQAPAPRPLVLERLE
jgi:pyrimidine-nucleoside phosphorylase